MRAFTLPFLAALLILPPAWTHAQGPRGGRPPGQANPAAAQAAPAGQGNPAAPGNAAAADATKSTALNPDGGADGVPAIQEEGDAYVLNFAESGEDGMTLEDFVKVCYDATGRNFTYSKETGPQLREAKVRMFGTKRIPKQDFYAFFQIMMFINDFGCIEVGPPHLSVIVIQSLNAARGQGPSTSNVLNKPIYVLPEDLGQYEDQPAVLIRTVVHLPNTDVRQLVNSLRTVQSPNQQFDQMINAGQSNAIILTGFGANVAAQVKLLMLIDQASRIDEGVEPIFDVIKLEFAAPEDVADIIEQLLEARNKANQDLRRNIPVPAEGGMSSSGRGSTEAKILVDSRTSSLLIMAMPEDMPRIKDLVARLDVEVVEPERNYHIVALSNVKAEDLQKVLKDFLQDASRVTDTATSAGGRAPGTGGGSGANGRSNEVVVIADKDTNSLLIAASKTRFGEVLDLVRQLDKRQDQVLIETALIELAGDQSKDIGVELGFADIPGAGEIGGVGVTSFGLSSFQDTDSDGIPDQKVPSILKGMTGGIIDGDDFALPVLLRLFQTRTNTNVLNIPSVLVNNNGKAVVTTLDEQPTTTITAQGAGTTTQETFNGYQEAGITLTISPSISASRYLRLNVTLKVSSFSGTFSGAIPPPRITREIQTEVNVPDGDTMVIGGIITDNQSETREQTPWLGDIPIIGALFRRDTSSNKRTTLYFFVTPHILKDEDFADLAEVSYRKKLAAAEVMGSGRIKMVDSKFGAAASSRLGGGFEIPLYRSPEGGVIEAEAVGLDPVRQSELLREARKNEAAGDKPIPQDAATDKFGEPKPAFAPAVPNDAPDVVPAEPEPAPVLPPAEQPIPEQPIPETEKP
jgi:general secretion pathway protein D